MHDTYNTKFKSIFSIHFTAPYFQYSGIHIPQNNVSKPSSEASTVIQRGSQRPQQIIKKLNKPQ
jgi:hypothetical protein